MVTTIRQVFEIVSASVCRTEARCVLAAANTGHALITQLPLVESRQDQGWDAPPTVGRYARLRRLVQPSAMGSAETRVGSCHRPWFHHGSLLSEVQILSTRLFNFSSATNVSWATPTSSTSCEAASLEVATSVLHDFPIRARNHHPSSNHSRPFLNEMANSTDLRPLP